MSENRPKWLHTVLALCLVAFGVAGTTRPYWTLENIAILVAIVAVLLVIWRGSILHRSALGVLVVVAAVGVAFSREVSVPVVVYSVQVYLILAGIHALVLSRKRGWMHLVLGIGLMVMGLLGLYWIDVASILTGLLLAPLALIVGAYIIVRTWLPHLSPHHHPKLMLNLARVGAIALLLLGGVSTYFTAVAIRHAPVEDDFAKYDAPLGDQPGVLLAAEPFDRKMPENSAATRILYTTTGLDGSIVLATGLVIVPADAPAEPLPVILWAHGTTGVGVHCAPTLVSDPLGAGAMMFPDLPLNQGWALVAPDYIGLGASAPHPYMVGRPTAHSSLDAVRAARQLESVSLSDDTVVWGHSQGGGSALWIGIEAEEYAPDVPLLGVAAMSPASDLPEFIDSMLSGLGGPIFGGFIISGFSNGYDDVKFDDYIRLGARFSQEEIAERCLSEPSFLASVASVFITEPFYQKDVHTGPLYTRLQENVPNVPLGVPLFLGQGEADPLIIPEVQTQYVAKLCDSGQVVEYHTYPGLDHLGVVNPDSPMLGDLMSWTEARFARKAAPESCTTNGE